jgi:hypothetical protein
MLSCSPAQMLNRHARELSGHPVIHALVCADAARIWYSPVRAVLPMRFMDGDLHAIGYVPMSKTTDVENGTRESGFPCI